MSTSEQPPKTSVQVRVDAKLGGEWWAIMLRGILALALALCAFVWPQQTLDILIKILGAFFLIDGIINAVGAYRSNNKGAHLMPAIVGLAMGLVLLLWTGVSAKLFLILIGIWLVLQGIGLFLASRKIDPAAGERGLMGIIGGVLALIGIVFIFWTKTGVVAISWLIGLGALVIGCMLVYLATRVKKLHSHLESIGTGE